MSEHFLRTGKRRCVTEPNVNGILHIKILLYFKLILSMSEFYKQNSSFCQAFCHKINVLFKTIAYDFEAI